MIGKIKEIDEVGESKYVAAVPFSINWTRPTVPTVTPISLFIDSLSVAFPRRRRHRSTGLRPGENKPRKDKCLYDSRTVVLHISKLHWS